MASDSNMNSELRNDVGAGGLRTTELRITPRVVQRGKNVTMSCQFPPHEYGVYSVKWYKGTQEFYRYSPLDTPQIRLLPVNGIKVDRLRSNETHVFLIRVGANISGNYTCEAIHNSHAYPQYMASARLDVKDTCDKDGFIKVERRKKKPPCRNQCGTAQTGPNILLRPAVPTTQLYVSRLHHTTTVEQIVEYVRSKTNWTLRVEKLESRHNTNFKSFMVRVPTHHFETFLKEEFWPKGVIYRRFRGRLRDTTQRNTTPTLPVGGLRATDLRISPPVVQRGNDTTLACLYELTDAPLYSVKWYRGRHEFYRYSPTENPTTKIFPFAGINVDLIYLNLVFSVTNVFLKSASKSKIFFCFMGAFTNTKFYMHMTTRPETTICD
ncbi:hypothetical protein SFRURICE_020038 [Spodoptera frugiperda]|nr:hypothetical protein SFRURICE_020038 [Spodoptera frugiperda]